MSCWMPFRNSFLGGIFGCHFFGNPFWAEWSGEEEGEGEGKSERERERAEAKPDEVSVVLLRRTLCRLSF